MVDLSTVNLVLDILLKLIFLVIFGFIIVLLKKLDEVLQRAEKSAESLEHTAETVERFVDVANYIPFIGPKRNKIEKELEEEDEKDDEVDEK